VNAVVEDVKKGVLPPPSKAIDKKKAAKQKKRREDKQMKALGIVKSDLPPFGKSTLHVLDKTTSDNALVYKATLQSGRLKSFCEGIVSAGLTLGGDGVFRLNHQYVVRYMFEYIWNEATGKYHPTRLKYAPAVFWDVLHALTNRKKGFISYKIVDDPLPTWTVTSTADGGRPFGVISSTLSGYTTVDTTSAYTDALGYAAANSFFGELGEKLDCQDKKYREIDPADCSAFVAQRVQSVGGSIMQTYKIGAVASVCETEMRCHGKIKCKWIAQLGLTSVVAQLAERNITTAFVAPGGIAAHRIYHKLHGYNRHADEILLKPVPISEFAVIMETLLVKAMELNSPSAVPYSDVNNPFTQWEVTFDDFKIVLLICALRHFGKSSAIACNMFHKTTPYWFAATGDNPTRGAAAIMIPQVIEQNFATLKPYNQGDKWVYPMIWIDVDFQSTLGWFAGSGGFFTAAYNLLTNLVSTSEAAPLYFELTDLVTKWHNVMDLVQAWVPVAPLMNEPWFNSAITTAFIGSTDDDLILCSSPCEIIEDVRKHIDKVIVPVWYVTKSAGFDENAVAYSQAMQYLFNEPYSTDAEKGEIKQSFVVLAFLLPTIHVLGGGGNTTAIVEEEEYGYEMGGKGELKRRGPRPPSGSMEDYANKLKTVQEALTVANTIVGVM